MESKVPSLNSLLKSAGTKQNTTTLSNLAKRVRAAPKFKPSGAPLPGFQYNPPPPTVPGVRTASYTNGGKPVLIEARKSRKSHKSHKSHKSRKSRKGRKTNTRK